MSKFDAFMAGNAEPIENKKVIISERFKDKDGNPIPFEIRAITSEENDDLQRASYVNVPVPGKRNQFTREMDQIKYADKMVAASVVYPELDNAELQDSYGVKTPEALLSKMLYVGEYNKLAEEIANLSNIEGLAEIVAEAKN